MHHARLILGTIIKYTLKTEAVNIFFKLYI